MTKEFFIFAPGQFLGEGKITFSTSPQFLKFYTRWQIEKEASGLITASQVVEIQGEEVEKTVNTFTFKEIDQNSFVVILENELIGSVCGKGIKDEKTIAWEFREGGVLEGFEVYEKQERGDCFLHAEYGQGAQFRTIIEGLIWKKNE